MIFIDFTQKRQGKILRNVPRQDQLLDRNQERGIK